MDRQTLITLILREARRDIWNGKGRIFMSDFLRVYQVDEKTFLDAVQEMEKLWKGIEIKRSLVNDNVFIFHLADCQLSSE